MTEAAGDLLPDPVPLLDLAAQYAAVRADVEAAIQRVVASQHFILGPEVEALERAIAEYSQCAHAVGVSSGTDALLVALMALSIGPGDEVITTPFSFFATAGSIARVGARPVFVDIEPSTFNLDPSAVAAAITPRTRAIMPVHLYGQMVDMDAVGEIAARRGLAVIEDAAQAIGAEHRGQRPGSRPTLAALSFFPSKNLGAMGDGGMVVTNDEALARRLRLLRNHGFEPKYHSRILGGNFRLDALQAAVLRAKLPHLDAWTVARQKNALSYRRLMLDAGLIDPAQTSPTSRTLVPPYEAPQRRHVYNQFVVRVDAQTRDALRQHLARRGIASEVYYPLPLHLQDCFAELGYHRGALPESERAAAEALALPIYPELSAAQQMRVVDAIAEFTR